MSRLKYPLQQINQWDVALCVLCNRQSRIRPVRALFRIASRLGDGVFWYALMAALLIHYGMPALPAVIHMLAVGALCTVLYKLIKHKTLRPRPFNVHPAIVCTGNILDQFSFPSGHTLHATAFSLLVISYFPGLIWLVLPFSVLVALSRPILGLHYPSDVLAGATIGGAIAGFSLCLV